MPAAANPASVPAPPVPGTPASLLRGPEGLGLVEMGYRHSTATTNYVDYLDSKGALLTSSTGAFYTRMWSIADTTTTLKTITVITKASSAGGAGGKAPSSTLVCMKTSLQ